MAESDALVSLFCRRHWWGKLIFVRQVEGKNSICPHHEDAQAHGIPFNPLKYGQLADSIAN